jgi:ribosome maturation factor RimP
MLNRHLILSVAFILYLNCSREVFGWTVVNAVQSSCGGRRPGFTLPNKIHWIFLSQQFDNNESSSWQAEGERIILQAAESAGASPSDISIAWKTGRVIVTVGSSASYLGGDEAATSSILEDDEDVYMIVGNNNDDDDFSDVLPSSMTTTMSSSSSSSAAVDVVSIARAINAAFDQCGEGSVGYNIAMHHEIEVTTPGASDELVGNVMFEAYRGFPVMLAYRDAKTNKTKTIEGKLVERTDEYTQINVKGRMRKFKNELVESVRLPKAKKEKGVR